MNNNNFESWKKGKNESSSLKNHLEKEGAIIGNDYDEGIIENDLSIKNFINKEEFKDEDLPEAMNIVMSLSNRDNKLFEDIKNLKREGLNFATELEDNILKNNLQNSSQKLSDEYAEKLLDLLKHASYESQKETLLLENRLYVANSMNSIFDKVISLLEKRKELDVGLDMEEKDKFASSIEYFKGKKQIAESIRLSVESKLLEIKGMNELANSLKEKKKITDFLKNKFSI